MKISALRLDHRQPDRSEAHEPPPPPTAQQRGQQVEEDGANANAGDLYNLCVAQHQQTKTMEPPPLPWSDVCQLNCPTTPEIGFAARVLESSEEVVPCRCRLTSLLFAGGAVDGSRLSHGRILLQ